jgi:hypothetical protein
MRRSDRKVTRVVYQDRFAESTKNQACARLLIIARESLSINGATSIITVAIVAKLEMRKVAPNTAPAYGLK